MEEEQSEKTQGRISLDTSFDRRSSTGPSGDRLESGNDGMEDINDMVDKLISLSFAENEPQMMANSSSFDRNNNLCVIKDNQLTSLGSKFFPSPTEVQSFVPRIKYVKSYPMKGPDEHKIRLFLSKTKYSLTVSPRQRMYGWPSPSWSGPEPGKGCQVFVGKIPKQLFEDVLIPLFASVGPLYGMRLMMEGSPSVLSRGFAFVMYTTPEDASLAVRRFDNWEIIPSRFIKVALSDPNCRLFLGNLPKDKSISDIDSCLSKSLTGVTDVHIFPDPANASKNRGYCFVDFESHQSVSYARKQLLSAVVKVFGVIVFADFADPLIEADEEVMRGVKIVSVQGLPRGVTQTDLFQIFSEFGDVAKVDKYRDDSAKIYYNNRVSALRAIDKKDGKNLLGHKIKVSLARPPLTNQQQQDIMFRRTRKVLSSVNDSLSLTNSSYAAGAARGQSRVIPNALQLLMLNNMIRG